MRFFCRLQHSALWFSTLEKAPDPQGSMPQRASAPWTGPGIPRLAFPYHSPALGQHLHVDLLERHSWPSGVSLSHPQPLPEGAPNFPDPQAVSSARSLSDSCLHHLWGLPSFQAVPSGIPTHACPQRSPAPQAGYGNEGVKLQKWLFRPLLWLCTPLRVLFIG